MHNKLCKKNLPLKLKLCKNPTECAKSEMFASKILNTQYYIFSKSSIVMLFPYDTEVVDARLIHDLAANYLIMLSDSRQTAFRSRPMSTHFMHNAFFRFCGWMLELSNWIINAICLDKCQRKYYSHDAVAHLVEWGVTKNINK